jgi:hypothetical protein
MIDHLIDTHGLFVTPRLVLSRLVSRVHYDVLKKRYPERLYIYSYCNSSIITITTSSSTSSTCYLDDKILGYEINVLLLLPPLLLVSLSFAAIRGKF